MKYFIPRSSAFYRIVLSFRVHWLYVITIVLLMSIFCGAFYGIYGLMGTQLDIINEQIVTILLREKALPKLQDEIHIKENDILSLESSLKQVGGDSSSGAMKQKKIDDIILCVKKSGMYVQILTVGKVSHIDWYKNATLHLSLQGNKAQWLAFVAEINGLKAIKVANYTINVDEKTQIYAISIDIILYWCH